MTVMQNLSAANQLPEWLIAGGQELRETQQRNKLRKHRSIWISDVHLGTRGSKSEFLSDFLKHNDCETLYLVGDIIDGWRMKKKAYWPQAHTNVIRRILTRAKRGTKVIYVTGNHDEFLRRYSGMDFGNIHLVDECVHQTPAGKKLWVIHGDRFDAVVCNGKWLAHLGDHAYEFMLKLNVVLNHVRRKLGMGYWSLSCYVKYKVKKAVNFIGDFERILADECGKLGYDGVVCGHIHHPEIRMIGDKQYCNSGDWVESCSALVESFDGELSIIRWTSDNGHHLDIAEQNKTAEVEAGGAAVAVSQQA